MALEEGVEGESTWNFPKPSLYKRSRLQGERLCQDLALIGARQSFYSCSLMLLCFTKDEKNPYSTGVRASRKQSGRSAVREETRGRWGSDTTKETHLMVIAARQRPTKTWIFNWKTIEHSPCPYPTTISTGHLCNNSRLQLKDLQGTGFLYGEVLVKLKV